MGKSFKIPSRNKAKQYDENPISVKCTICNHIQEVTEENTEIVFNTTTYWCENCGEQFIQGMKCFDYKYS